MIKNKSRLATKLFIIVWIVLAVHIALKLTFNYWQPYVIPNEQLQVISDFIDANRWIRIMSDAITYTFNGYIMICCSLQLWCLKSKKQNIIVISIAILSYLHMIFIKQSDLLTLLLNFGIPLIINYRKWLYIIITFIFNNLFLALSLWLTEFVNCNDMPYIIQMLFFFDYYIMMILCYFVFNLIRKKELKNG